MTWWRRDRSARAPRWPDVQMADMEPSGGPPPPEPDAGLFASMRPTAGERPERPLDQAESRSDAQTGRSEPRPVPTAESLSRARGIADHLRLHHSASVSWAAERDLGALDEWHRGVHDAATGAKLGPGIDHTHDRVTVPTAVLRMPTVSWGLLPGHELDQVHAAYAEAIGKRGGRDTPVAGAVHLMLSVQPMLRELTPDRRLAQEQTFVAALRRAGVSERTVVDAAAVLLEVDHAVKTAARRLSD